MNIGKKLLSLLTVFCLTLSLVPTMALAADATSIWFGYRDTHSVTLNSTTPYLASNSTQAVATQPNEATGYAYFTNGTLTLHNYNNSSTAGIFSGYYDLTIKLEGKNSIKSSDNGICTYKNLTISGPGSLSLTAAGNGTTVYAGGTLTINNGAKVSAPSGQSGQSFHVDTSNGRIIITGAGTKVNAIDSAYKRGIVRSGIINDDDKSYNGTIEVSDGAKLQATQIEGTLIVDGENSSLDSNKNEVSSNPVKKYVVSGKVTDGTSDIVGASVQLCSTTGTANALASAVIRTSTTTENDGTYHFSNVPAGKYTIQASKDGYTSSTSQPVTVESANVTDTNLTLSLIKYNVYVNGTQVTGINKDNVLSDANQTVKYTPASEDGITPQKLTLNGVNISNTINGIKASNDLTITLSGSNVISGSGHAINMTSGALTITGPGSLEASSNSGQTTVYTKGDVTINDGAKITATNTSISNGDVFDLGDLGNKHTLTITGTGTQVTAQKTVGSEVAINHISTLTVNDGATLTAQSNGTAISCDTFTRGVGYTVNVDATNYDGSGATANYQDNSRTAYKYVEVKPGNTTSAGTSYGVWVGNTKVTSDNASNVLSDGKVSYDPATKTLTLKGATITGAANRAYTSAINDACGIYSTHALTINLVGRNTMSGATTSDYGNYGIFVNGKLTFTSSDSDGSLTVSGGESKNKGNAWVPGIYASGITVNNCNVIASGGTAEKDKYPVSYAMSTAPTLIGVEVTKANTANTEPETTLEYNKSKNSTYKYLQITKKTNADTTVADPVIEPESGYFTGSVAVKMSCLTNGTTIYYTTDGSEPTTRNMKYTNDIALNETKTIKAIAVKSNPE